VFGEVKTEKKRGMDPIWLAMLLHYRVKKKVTLEKTPERIPIRRRGGGSI